jgi:hypothetical protein
VRERCPAGAGSHGCRRPCAFSGAPAAGWVRHVDDSELAEVAKVYRTAGAQGRSPIDAVREHFYLSRRTAERAIARARRAVSSAPR